MFGLLLGWASLKNPTQKRVSLVYTGGTSHVGCLKVRLLEREISKHECTTLIGGLENPSIIYASVFIGLISWLFNPINCIRFPMVLM